MAEGRCNNRALPDAEAPDLSGRRARPTAGWPVLLAGGAAAAAALAVAVVVLLDTLPGDHADLGASPLPSASDPAPSQSETARPTPIAEPSWEIITIAGVEDVRGVVELNGRLVAGGWNPSADTLALAWSDDAVEWTPADVSYLDLDASGIDGLIAGRDGLVATGVRYPDGPMAPGIPFILFSADGIAWEEVVHPGGCASAEHAATGAFGYVMVGTPECIEVAGRDPRPLTVLSSTDGRTWTTATHESQFDDISQKPWRLATDGTRIVAIEFQSAAWISDDGGETWDAREAPFGAGVSTDWITYGHGMFLVTGSQLPEGGSPPIPIACVSHDGEAWTCREAPASLNWAQATPTGFVAHIRLIPDDRDEPIENQIVTSTEGLEWAAGAAEPELRDISIHHLFPTTYGLFVAGGTEPIAEPLQYSEPRVAVHRGPLP